MSRRQAFALAAAVALSLAPAGMQQPPRQPSAQTFRTGVDVVFVDVSVRDGARVVTGLRAEDFELRDNGVRQRIESVEATAVPIDLTVLVDVSGNVTRVWTDRPKAVEVLGGVETQIAQLVAMLRPEDRVRVLVVDEHVQLAVPWTSPPRISPPRRIEFHGKPALYDALAAALTHGAGPARRHVVVAATKGREGVSSIDAVAVREMAEQADALFHVLLLEAAADDDDETARFRCAELGYCWPSRLFWMPSRRMLFGPREKHELTFDGIAIGSAAESTGGSLHKTTGLSEPTLFGTVKKTLESFRGGYMLRYTPQGVTRTGWHDIDVRVRGRRAYTVRSRNGYAGEEPPRPPAPPPATADPPRRLDDYVAAYDRGAYLEVASALRRAANLGRLLRDFDEADNPWPATPRREAVFALELAEPGVFSRDRETHARALALLERFTQLVRHPIEPDAFELYWHFAALTILEGALRPRETDAFVARALERFPAEPRFLLSRAITADQLTGTAGHFARPAELDKEAERIRALYASAIEQPQTSAEARVRIAWMLHRLERHGDALVQLEAAVRVKPQERAIDYLAHLIRGHALLALGRQEEGIAAFRSALTVFPAAQSARVGLMNALVMGGRRAEAQALADQVQAARDDGVDPWWEYWQGQYRLLPAVMARLRELMVQ